MSGLTKGITVTTVILIIITICMFCIESINESIYESVCMFCIDLLLLLLFFWIYWGWISIGTSSCFLQLLMLLFFSSLFLIFNLHRTSNKCNKVKVNNKSKTLTTTKNRMKSWNFDGNNKSAFRYFKAKNYCDKMTDAIIIVGRYDRLIIKLLK